MREGWDASNHLPKLLAARGMTQHQLAIATWIDRGTINGYCTGRLDLGSKNAMRIAEALNVSVLDLGAPKGEAPAEALLLDARLGSLEESAVRFEDLALMMRVLRLLAIGNRREALRALSEAEVQ